MEFRGVALLLLMSLAVAASARAAGPPTVCLFTDFGWDDPYVAQLKGVIITLAPTVRLVDLNHSPTAYNVTEGGYLLNQCAAEFPSGTIFVAVVDPQVGTDRDPILIETNKGEFFVGPDNGLFAQVIQTQGLLHAWKLDKPEFYRPGDVSRTFHGRDIFGPVAAHLAGGTDPERLGTQMKTLEVEAPKEAILNDGIIEAQVLHIDHYGNIILNLKSGSDLGAKLKEGTLLRVTVDHQSYSAPFVRAYGDVNIGRLLLLFGSSGELEISVNQGSAVRQIKVEPGSTVYLKP